MISMRVTDALPSSDAAQCNCCSEFAIPNLTDQDLQSDNGTNAQANHVPHTNHFKIKVQFVTKITIFDDKPYFPPNLQARS